ncbi:MAG TPA: cupredoxin domain-containing protein [Gaiellales bacterium]|jgi:uncharacterized cupredoxin-like copper-binding protein|nr:cupredoxin domain-containing protein [Gaiellales bacterium]
MRPTSIALTAVAAALLIAVPATAAPARHAAKTTTITVGATEFKFTLSKKSAPKGTVVFKVTNKGKVAHDFKINGKTTPLLKPKKSATLTVKFPKTGKFPYLCTVPGHAAAGMKGTFTITA